MIRVLSFTVALLFSAFALAQSQPQLASTLPDIPPVNGILAHNGMVVAQESRAARIGVEILDRGGNAVDAAVAVGFAMAVTYPRAGNLGGGGFMVIHLASGNRDIAIDYRETAPAAATPTMFLDAQGNADPKKSRDSGARRSAFPAPSPGWRWREAKYGSGKFTLADLIAPAIDLAANGFRGRGRSCRFAAAPRTRGWRAGHPPRAFFSTARRRWPRVTACCNSISPTRLRAIAERGPAAFYKGRDRRQDRGGGQRRRRHHDGRRPRPLSRRSSVRSCAAAIAATTSCRCRRRRPAACI